MLMRYPGPTRAKGKVKSKEMEEESAAWLKSGQNVLKLAHKDNCTKKKNMANYWVNCVCFSMT